MKRFFRRAGVGLVVLAVGMSGLAAVASAAPLPSGLSYHRVVEQDRPSWYNQMDELSRCTVNGAGPQAADPALTTCAKGSAEFQTSNASITAGALAPGAAGTAANKSVHFAGGDDSWAWVANIQAQDDATANGTNPTSPPTFSIFYAPYTVEAWVQTTQVGASLTKRIFSLADSEVLALDGQGRPYVTFKTGAGTTAPLTGPTAINDGRWHHVALRVEPTANTELIVDGAVVGTMPTPQVVPTNVVSDGGTGFLTADDMSVGWGFAGAVDEVAIYNPQNQPTTAVFLDRFGYGSTERQSYMQQVMDDQPGWYSAMDGIDPSIYCVCFGPGPSNSAAITTDGLFAPRFTMPVARVQSTASGVLLPPIVGAGTNQAVVFDGTDGSWAYLGDNTSGQLLGRGFQTTKPSERATLFASTALTIEAWINTTQTATDPTVGRRHIMTAGGYDLSVDDSGRPRVDVQTSSGVAAATSSIVVTDGAWHHVAFTYDAGSLTLYLDGAVTATATLPPSSQIVYASDASASIGWGFSGLIDEVAAYPRALSAGQLAAHHDSVAGLRSYYEVNYPSLYGNRPSQTVVSDPVDTASGNFLHQESDLSGDGYGMTLGRTYNSRDSRRSVLGTGWSGSYSDRLEVSGTAVLYTDASGRQVSLTANADGSYTRPADVTANLAKNADGSWTLGWFNGDVYQFTAAGLMSGARSSTGQSVTVTRDSAGRVGSVANSIGVTFTYGYNADGLLTSVVSSDGRTVAYAYTGGELSSVTLPDGKVWHYQFSPAHLLLSVTDPAGIVTVANTYDASGRVATQQLGSQATMVFFTYDDTTGTTVTWNASTNEHLTYHHDRQGRVTSITDPVGNSVARSYDGTGRLASATDRKGAVTTEVRDANANLLSSTVPGEGTSTYTYDSANRILTATDASGATTTFTYTGTERFPATVTDASGAVTTNVVANGLVTKTTDPDGVARTFTYNARRQPVTVTDGLGRATTFTYDSHGWRTAVTNPAGGVASTTYDSAGRVLTRTDPAGAVTTNAYDTAGRMVSVTDPTGAITRYGYDVKGRPASITAPDGTVTATGFDDLGRPVSSTAPGAAVSSTSYGNLSRVASTADPVGRTSSYGYDVNGNQTSVTAPDGGVSSTTFNTAGQVTGSTDPVGRQSTTSYDALGRVASETAPGGLTSSYAYDRLGRITATTAPDGGVTRTVYTPGGRMGSMTDPTGRKVTYAYDAAGQLVSTTDNAGAVTRYGYDTLGRRTTVTDPTGLVTTTTYDAVGNVLSVKDPAGVTVRYTWSARHEKLTEKLDGQGVVTYTYNAVGTLATVTDALGRTTSYGYDSRRNQTSRTDVTGAVSRWEYNAADQLTASVDPLGRRTTYTYDAAGRVAASTDGSGRTTTNTYDLSGKILSRVSSGAGTSAVTVSYTYDSAGRRATMVDPTGTTTYTYDPAGRLASIARPTTGTIRYGYDTAGRRTSLTYPDGTVATYAYDSAGRLATVTAPGSGTITYTYDPAGRPLTTSGLPGGVTRTTGYTAGRPTSYSDSGRTTTIGYDPTGRIATMTGADPASFGYDAASELTSATTNGIASTYGYDSTGGIATSTAGGVTTTFTRDTAKELTKTVTGTVTTTVASDGAGRITTETGTDGTVTATSYDARGLPVRIDRTTPIPPPDVPYPQANFPLLVVPIVAPIFECAAKQPNGKWTAYFGYDNDSFELFRRVGVTIPRGLLNRLIGPGTATATLPEKFGVPNVVAGDPGRTAPGRQNPKAFIATDWDGRTLTWQLGALFAVATTTKVCTDTPPATTQTTSEQRTYDGDSNLAAITTTAPTGATTSSTLAWDPAASIPQVLASTTAGTSSRYLYGQHRETATAGTATTAFTYNALGDTIATATSSAATVAGGYDPWGLPQTNPQPSNAIRFGYRHELVLNGVVHLRARDFRPDLRQFTTTDPLDGTDGSTTLNSPYAYGFDNPVTYRDPSGQRATSDAGFRSVASPVSTVSAANQVGGSGVAAAASAATTNQTGAPPQALLVAGAAGSDLDAASTGVSLLEGGATGAASDVAAGGAEAGVVGTTAGAVAGTAVVTLLVGYYAIFGSTIGAKTPIGIDVCVLWCQDLRQDQQEADEATRHLAEIWKSILTKRSSQGLTPIFRGIQFDARGDGSLKSKNENQWRKELRTDPDGLSFFEFQDLPNPDGRNTGLLPALVWLPASVPPIAGATYKLVLPEGCGGTYTPYLGEGKRHWSVNCPGGAAGTTSIMAEYGFWLFNNPPLPNPNYRR